MKICVYASLLIGVVLLSGSLGVSGQATKETPKANAEAKTGVEAQLFHFGGGDLNQFLTKLRDQFGKEVYELIQIRGANADRIHLPKMRIRISGVGDVREVLATYNRISSEGDGFLGKWIYSPAMSLSLGGGLLPSKQAPETIVFLGPKAGSADGTAGIQVRAFSVRGISTDRLKALEELIHEQSRRLQQEIAERSGDLSSAEGRVSVHQGTGLLIASGGKTYVELVGTLMDAFRTLQEKINANEPPPPKPKVVEPH
jgi:hypothetical protein